MNKRLQAILNLIQESKSLTPEEKISLADAVKESDKEITITEFKLERTEKVKRTTAILLEETIAELEEKRKSVEAQNRELEIEAALERVRSRSIAMRQSSELGDLSFELVKQVQALGIATWHCAFNIYDENQESSTEWGSNANGSYPTYKTPREGIFRRYYEVGQRGETLHIEVIGEDKCAEHYAYLCTLPGVGETLVKLRDSGISFPKSQIDHVAYFKYGYLLFITFEPAPEGHDIFKRFAKVFEQTYTRFLDLQKAEAQTRLAQIEVSLERVRARAIGMHHSDELSEVLSVLFDQFDVLGIEPVYTFLSLVDLDKNKFIYRQTGKGGQRVIAQQVIDLDRMEEWKDLFESMRAGKVEPINCLHYPKESLEKVWEVFNEIYSALPEGSKVYPEDFPDGVYTTQAYCKFGYLGFDHTRAASEEDKDILQRFAKEFTRLYQRFLDLQQAEAQARESQIQLALERVRARTMAMHKSEELAETAHVLFQQLIELGGFPDRISIGTVDEPNGVVNFWTTDQQGSHLNQSFSARLNERTTIEKTHQAWKQQKKSLVIDLQGEELKEWIQFAREEMGIAVRGDQIKDRRVHTVAFFSHGWILVTSHLPQSTETIQILERFASVFNLTYRRFLDLKKAEAQAREAQIEAALERVRSRAMGMQTSEELNALIGTVFTELTKLDLVLTRCVIMTYDHKTNDARWWMANSEAPEQPMNFHVQYHEHPPNLAYFSAWRERTVKWIYNLEGKVKKEWDDFIFNETELRRLPDFVIAGMKAPDQVYLNVSFFNSGNLTLASLEPLSDEHFDILIRFAKVFDLTYTRFNDLKQAEAQAREAKIETALEKVRSRTMAMQRSEELVDVASILFQQVKGLGVPQWNCGLNIWEIGDKEFTFYPGTPDGILSPKPCKIPLTEHPVFISFDESRKRGDELFVYEKEGEYQAGHYRYMLSLPGVGDLLQNMLDAGFQLPTYQIDHVVNFSHGNLIFITYEHFPEMHDVFKRFGKVFEQTYTRFLDLQQAEGQAREGQIQLALERVRARTMAMQNSNELRDAASVLFQQVKELGIDAWTCGFSIWNEDRKTPTAWLSRGVMQPPFKTPLMENPTLRHFYEAAQRGETLFVEEVAGETLAELYRYLGTLLVSEGISGEIRKPGYAPPTFQVNNVAYFSYGYLLFVTYKHYPEAHDIFKRFAKVFEQTYTRFLDLQKAEAQVREAQIEASLERVRSKTMAMHNSHDVGDTVATLFDELTKLGVKTNRCGILIFGDSDVTEVWTAKSNPSGKANLIIGHLDVALHPMLTSARNAWKNKETSFSYEMVGDDLINYYQTISTQPGYRIQVNMDALPSKEIHTEFYFPEGAVFAFTPEAIEVDAPQIFKRLASVFGQTYRRYLDLQKAEAQAREAQIEAALERVRSRTMAMHRSEEIADIVGRIFKELTLLDVALNRVLIWIFNAEEKYFTWWSANPEAESNAESYRVDYVDHPVFSTYYEAWQKRSPLLLYTLGDDLKVSWDDHLFKNTELSRLPKAAKDGMRSEEKIFTTSAISDYGLLMAGSFEPFSDEVNDIIQRFGRVFQQSYTRYLDVQKAEAQAREAQIEAALERTRTQSMLMQHSVQLDDTLRVFHEQVLLLGIKSAFSFLWLPDENNDRHIFWAVWAENSSSEQVKKDLTVFKSKAINYPLDRNEPATAQCLVDWKSDQPVHSYHVRPADVENYFAVWKELLDGVDKLKPRYFQGGLYYVEAFMKYGCFGVMIEVEMPEDEKKILGRLAIEFERAYTRFLDLQKAEAQALEATIEASLEKVRGKAMAMHNSNDLSVTASMVFTELRKLGINPFRCGVSLQTKESRKNLLYYSIPSAEGDTLSLAGSAMLSGHPVLSAIYDNWVRGEDYFPVLTGESLINYYQTLKKAGFDVPVLPSGHEQYGYYLAFSEGVFYVWSEKPYTEAEIKILHRFRGIVDLTFRRYMELEKSESIAKEAIRQASLDRVRAEIASMRTTADLDRITPLIWKELNILNIPFVRCGVFIMDEVQHKMHTFLSTPEGKAIAAFNLPYESPGNVGEILTHWLDKQTYISHWDETAFSELGEQLVQQGAILSKEVYMSTVPPGGIHLHCLPFLQGMLYVGNTAQLQESDIHLIQSVADAFSTAYARYEDFNKLESAKAQIEKTLTDLKLTQNQLVQSEKMASLGELTAGIAHEIQNPLNFVNNFSEVSNELLDEMKEEIQKGNYEEVQTITSNIKQNLEKILHHGKRADGIVKGMLQHSRSSSGVKEPTDINALADEYLRLAYHGFRAKDKSFNASTHADLDKSIGKINVVPQDIGRVILNLITNAFFAVTEKQNKTSAAYQPTVHLSTKRHDDCVLISVKDNGNGIPEHIREKIFQPFFTTKPTGQGTGLGLSLSYDIVKAHGGELKVETKEGEGSEFVIHLPI